MKPINLIEKIILQKTVIWVVSDCDTINQLTCSYSIYVEVEKTILWKSFSSFIELAAFKDFDEAFSFAEKMKEMGIHKEIKTGYTDRRDWSIVEAKEVSPYE